MLLATAAAIGIAAATALSSFLVVYGVTLGLSERLLGAVVASASVIALAVRLGVGWAADRLSRSGLRAVAALLCLLALGIALVMSGIPALFVVGSYIALGPSWGWGWIVRSGVVRVQPSAGSSTGVIESGMNGGAAVGGILFGYAANTLGYRITWGVLAALVMAASLIGLAVASGLRPRAAQPARPRHAGRPCR